MFGRRPLIITKDDYAACLHPHRDGTITWHLKYRWQIVSEGRGTAAEAWAAIKAVTE